MEGPCLSPQMSCVSHDALLQSLTEIIWELMKNLNQRQVLSKRYFLNFNYDKSLSIYTS
ncbi:mCG147340 [Mus musculus]|nr:mCG147340 [Mus musculus]